MIGFGFKMPSHLALIWDDSESSFILLIKSVCKLGGDQMVGLLVRKDDIRTEGKVVRPKFLFSNVFWRSRKVLLMNLGLSQRSQIYREISTNKPISNLQNLC